MPKKVKETKEKKEKKSKDASQIWPVEKIEDLKSKNLSQKISRGQGDDVTPADTKNKEPRGVVALK